MTNENGPDLMMVRPYSEDECELAKMESSWADHARRLRTGDQLRSGPGGHFSPRGLRTVHVEFEYFHDQYRAGDRAALMGALRLAGRENLPMPYWLSDGINAAMDELSVTPSATLHSVFGFDKYYPETPKRAAKARLDQQTKMRLYEAVHDLMGRGMGKTAAIKKAVTVANLPIRPRIAFEWFNEVNDRQQKYLRHMDGRKLHKYRR